MDGPFLPSRGVVPSFSKPKPQKPSDPVFAFKELQEEIKEGVQQGIKQGEQSLFKEVMDVPVEAAQQILDSSAIVEAQVVDSIQASANAVGSAVLSGVEFAGSSISDIFFSFFKGLGIGGDIVLIILVLIFLVLLFKFIIP